MIMNALQKQLEFEKLKKELEELKNDKTAKKELDFFEDLKGLLDKYGFDFDDLKNVIFSVTDKKGDGRGRPKGQKAKSYSIEYEGKLYKVNDSGRQSAEVKELLDGLEISPIEFIQKYS